MVNHVVLFRLRDPADVARTVAVLRGMEGQIPSLVHLEVGVEERPSDRSAQIALITRFADWEGLDAYAVHPHHQGVLAHMATVVAEARKVDWQS